MADRAEVTVVVVTWNSASQLPDFLDALPAGMRDVPYELVVADNDSADGTLDVAAAGAPHATVVQLGRNAGYSAGVNAGIAAAGPSDAVLVLNPDIRLRPGCARRLVDELRRTDAGITVPKLVDGDGALAFSLRREPTVRRVLGEALLGGRRSGRIPALGAMVLDADVYERGATADWASGAAMLLSRECLAAVGPWDESFFLYDEEVDFCLRARDAGFPLRYVPDAVAVHLGGESHQSPRLWSIQIVNDLRLFRRRHGRLHAAAFHAALVTNEALRAAAGRATHRAGLVALLVPSRRPAEVRG